MPEIDKRSYQELTQAIELAQRTVYKHHLQELFAYPVLNPTPVLLDQTPEECVRLLQLEELSCKKGEDTFQKLCTVYHAAMSLGCSLIVMVDVAAIGAPANIYVGVRNGGADEKDSSSLANSFSTLQNGLLSSFPGSRARPVDSKGELPALVDDIFGSEDDEKYIASVSCVASFRDKSKTENKSFIQGLELFMDAMRGSPYTALFLAEPISPAEQANIRSGYESIYSALSPFRKSTWSYNENESKGVMTSVSEGVSDAVTNGTSHTQAHTFSVGARIGLGANRSTGSNESSKINTHMAASTIASTIGKNLGISGDLNAGYANAKYDTTTQSTTNTTSSSKTDGTSESKGSGRTLQFENVNKPIEEILKRIDAQLKRTEESEDYGAYGCSAYFMSGQEDNCLLAANTYRALMLGEGSSVESGAINAWSGQDDLELTNVLREYLRRFTNPIFTMPLSGSDGNPAGSFPCTACTIVSGLELPLHMGLPTRSVYGLPVQSHAEFGRNVTTQSSQPSDGEKIRLGCIYHMGQAEPEADVSLDAAALTAHTFITGSTGAGKSNAIYSMLNKLCLSENKNAKFLVIEPAKGEYKAVLGGYPGVKMFGTNPYKAKMLRVNPFAFPEEIHVLEHIDRLIEVFNACWPMYAAMPAVLKDAIEASYVECGWSLTRSVCRPRQFPTFEVLMKKLPEVMGSSSYSSDTKGDYTGALVTRVKSLTNGINGQIFCAESELEDSELFDQNVIVDLSRIGSMETKALIMGILTIKLQEYRINQRETGAEGANSGLRHITVLEEAHNLLRRTSSEQSQDSSNLQGKSVEMLANAIAEMRTYGEGFIIADQAPGLLDMAVIRNTNTKLILRLPDEADRVLVGKAAGLTDDQIVELAKLDVGVAAVFQNHWLEPVLCRVDHFEKKMEKPCAKQSEEAFQVNSEREALFRAILNGGEIKLSIPKEKVDALRNWIEHLDCGSELKDLLLNVFRDGKQLSSDEAGKVFYCLVKGKTLVSYAKGNPDPTKLQAMVDVQISDALHVSEELAGDIRKCIFEYAAERVDTTYAAELRKYGGVR